MVLLVRVGSSADPADRPGPGVAHGRHAGRGRRRSRRARAERSAGADRARSSTPRSDPTPRFSRSRRSRDSARAPSRCWPTSSRGRSFGTTSSIACGSCGPTACASFATCRRRSPIARSRRRSTARIRTGIWPSARSTRSRRWRSPRSRPSISGAFRPSRAVLVVVGDAPHEEIVADAARAFAHWARRRRTGIERGATVLRCSPTRRAGASRLLLVDRPGRGAVGAAHRARRRVAPHAGLSRAAAAEPRARRAVRQPAEHEPARAQGLHVRRAVVVRVPARAAGRSRCRPACRRT